MGILSNQNHNRMLDHMCHCIEVDYQFQCKDNFLEFHQMEVSMDQPASE